jgi:hypothetical protein
MRRSSDSGVARARVSSPATRPIAQHKNAVRETQRFGQLRGCIVIRLAPDEFLVAGIGAMVTFVPATGHGSAGLLRVQEGRYDDGRWVGDPTNQGQELILGGRDFAMQQVRVYTYR